MVEIYDKIVQDTLVVLLASLVGYIFKFSLKPNKNEVKFISQLMYILIALLMKWAEDHIDTKPHLDKARQEFVNLKNKMKGSNKIQLG